MDWIKNLMALMTISPKIQEWINLGKPVYDELQKADKNLIPVLEKIGLTLFPKLSGPIKTVAAAASALFDPQGTMWVQRSLNQLDNAGLVVDGVGGELTAKAVTKFQAAHQPDSGPVDGWAGAKTKAAIAAALAKLS